MQRQGQRNRKPLLRQSADSRHNAAGGYGNVSLTDIQPLVMGYQTDKTYYVIIIIHRLTGSHNYNIGNPLPGISLNAVNLIQHLSCCKISFQAIQR